MGTYIPHTDAEVAQHARLPRTGVARRAVRRRTRGAAPRARARPGRRLPEPDVLAHIEELGEPQPARSDPGLLRRRRAPTTTRSRRSPRPCAGRSEFVTSYTPYQPEVAQGVLQAVFEYQTLVARLSGLPVANASLYDGASAAVEAVNLGGGATGRQTVWVSARRPSPLARGAGHLRGGHRHQLVDIPLVDGPTDWAEVDGLTGDDRPGVLVVGYPNYLGCLEDLACRPGLVRPQRRPPGRRLRPGGCRRPALAGGVGRRRGGGGGPGLRHAPRLRRPLPRPVRLPDGPRPAPPGPAGGRDRRRRGPPRLRHDAAGPGTGHPPGEGDVERLHQPDPHGGDRCHPAGLAGDGGDRPRWRCAAPGPRVLP